MSGSQALKIAAGNSGINHSARDIFLSLYPNRHKGILKPRGCQSWVTLSKHAPISDQSILEAVSNRDETFIGCRWAQLTRHLVLDIDSGSRHHNELGLSRLRHSLALIGFISPKLYRSSASQGWHLYLFLDNWELSDEIQTLMKAWLAAEGYEIKQGQLELFPSKNGLRLPLQHGFAWLDDKGNVALERANLSPENAITKFVDDSVNHQHSWEIVSGNIRVKLARLTEKKVHTVDQAEDGFTTFFTTAGMIPEVYAAGQNYWQNGLTAAGQRHHATLCLGHYLWYGDEAAGVRAMPGIGRGTDRAAVIESWLRENHNGKSQAVLNGNWDVVTADIRRACNWTAQEGTERTQESYPLTDRSIDRLVGLSKKTGRTWLPEDLKKGNVRREEEAREKIRLALNSLLDEKRRVSVRALQRLSGCKKETIKKHCDIWGSFRLSNGPGDLSAAVGPGLEDFDTSDEIPLTELSSGVLPPFDSVSFPSKLPASQTPLTPLGGQSLFAPKCKEQRAPLLTSPHYISDNQAYFGDSLMSDAQAPFQFPVIHPTYHRACGIVRGCVVGHSENTNAAFLTCPDGSTFQARVLNPGGKKFVARGWQNLMVYPNSDESELLLLVAYPRRNQSEPDRYFEVQGFLEYRHHGYLVMAIWSERNRRLSFVRVKGELPKANYGEVWWLECFLSQDGLHLVSGLKLAETWTAPISARQLETAAKFIESRPQWEIITTIPMIREIVYK